MKFHDPAQTDKNGRTLRLGLLAVGAVVGLAMAVSDIVDRPRSSLDGVAAVVNETVIAEHSYEARLELISRERRTPLTEEDKARILERMIEEELLIQRGIELDFVAIDRSIRSALVRVVIDSVVAEAHNTDIPDSSLRDFYAENAGFFVAPERIAVSRIAFLDSDHGGDSRAQAAAALSALGSGEPVATVAAKYGSELPVQVPQGLLPMAKLRDYVGPDAVNALAGLAAGDTTVPIKMPWGYQVLHVDDRQLGLHPELAEIRETVKAAYVKSADDKALQDYLEFLKTRARIFRPALPQ